MNAKCAVCALKEECYIQNKVSFTRLMFQMGMSGDCPDFTDPEDLKEGVSA